MKKLFVPIVAAAFLVSSCCTSQMVYNPETQQEEKETDCLNPVEMAVMAVAIPVIVFTDPFN